jgi:protein-disulfide isomerase
MLVSRRVVIAMLLLTGLAALAHFSPLRLITDVMVQNAADATRASVTARHGARPADAKVTITEYASPTCPHCADFNAKVFPKIKAAYIDTGKVRYSSASSRVTSRMPPARCWRAASPTATWTNVSPSSA